ncbi:MAG: hypothetical protein IJA10_00045 [Lachnospiraceae bacterium]|nr:hypothetical protein [Lachnospiraceae bacterium]
MEKLLETLAEIEEKANRIMDHAHSYKSTLDQEKKEKLQQLEEESKKNLDEKVAALKAKTDSEIAKSKEKLQADTMKQLNTLNLINDAELERMSDKIVAGILEGAVI